MRLKDKVVLFACQMEKLPQHRHNWNGSATRLMSPMQHYGSVRTKQRGSRVWS